MGYIYFRKPPIINGFCQWYAPSDTGVICFHENNWYSLEYLALVLALVDCAMIPRDFGWELWEPHFRKLWGNEKTPNCRLKRTCFILDAPMQCRRCRPEESKPLVWRWRWLNRSSGIISQFANLKMAIEIVDLPIKDIKKDDFPWLC